MLASVRWPCELVCLADRALLAERARRLGLDGLNLRDYRAGRAGRACCR